MHLETLPERDVEETSGSELENGTTNDIVGGNYLVSVAPFIVGSLSLLLSLSLFLPSLLANISLVELVVPQSHDCGGLAIRQRDTLEPPLLPSSLKLVSQGLRHRMS